MKKVVNMKRISILLAIALLISISVFMNILPKGKEMQAQAAESTAAVKSFQTNGLTYLGDKNNVDIHIKTDSYDYGSFSMWSACYKYVCTEPNGSQTCYYYALIESSICSSGKYGKYRFFRNKYLDVAIDFWSKDGQVSTANFTPESSGATTGSTIGLGLNGGVNVGTSGIGGNIGGSVSYSETVTYDAVTLTLSKDTVGGHQNLLYHYKFMNWDDGAMVAPNIGLVQKRMVAIFSVENYTGGDNFSMNITTTATIFKDATWPRKNATLDGSISHNY